MNTEIQDFYNTKEECISSKRNKNNTNPRYTNFKQKHFTAGDEEQFESNRYSTNKNICVKNIDIEDNVFKNQELDSSIKWDKYSTLSSVSCINTFRYVYNKIKKGLFIKIQDNELKVFLPFSKNNFKNEWSNRIQIDPKYDSFERFLQHIHTDIDGRWGDIQRVETNKENWYANNCLVRFESPIDEGDSNVGTIRDMLIELCKSRDVPDIELFLNRRDFPILKADSTEPYNHIFDNEDFPLLSHNYDKYVPILSISKSEKYSDILMPSYEDWERVSLLENKFFPDSCNVKYEFKTTKEHWNLKKHTAVFRGGTTGCGVTAKTNMRIKIAKLSSEENKIEDGEPYLDAKITKWNTRPRKLQGQRYLQTIERNELGRWAHIPSTPEKKIHRGRDGIDRQVKTNGRDRDEIRERASFLSSNQQSEQYKYIVHIDGHVSAFRLSLELSMGCVILLQNSPYKTWYKNMLKEYEHYVPINNDLSDINEKIKWCRDNDDKCFQITQNAIEFYNKYLSKNGILDYLQKLFVDIKTQTGNYLYNYIDPLDIQLLEEEKIITESITYPILKNNLAPDILYIPIQPRDYGFLRGIHLVINTINEVLISHIFNRYIFTEIFSNKLSKVYKATIGINKHYQIIKKVSSDVNKKKEILHETFVGFFGINEVLKKVPNFYYIFALHESGGYTIFKQLLGEYVEGSTFSQYLKPVIVNSIKRYNYNFKDYLFILIQIALSIQIAQDTCGFVHYDLTPWNIILKNVDVSIDYPISYKQVYNIKTNLVPIIIDYGKSKIIYKNQHYGFINMYKTSTIQDIITIIITSLNEIVDDGSNSNNILKLSRFLISEYCSVDDTSSIYKLKKFISRSKSFEKISNSNKFDLEEKNPIDFVNYIIKNFKEYKFNITSKKYFSNIMDVSNPRQICEYIRSHNIEERISSYTDVFYRIKKSSIPLPRNVLFLYYSVQKIIHNLLSVNIQLENFLESVGKDRKTYKKLFDNTISFIIITYNRMIKKYTIELKNTTFTPYITLRNYRQLQPALYNKDSFLDPDDILKIVTYYNSQHTNKDITQKRIITDILLFGGKFKLPDNIYDIYKNHFLELIDTNDLIIMNNLANKNTLYNITKKIYTYNLENIKKWIEENLDKDCSSLLTYQNIYNNTIEIIDSNNTL
jgi:hypothetical protein